MRHCMDALAVGPDIGGQFRQIVSQSGVARRSGWFCQRLFLCGGLLVARVLHGSGTLSRRLVGSILFQPGDLRVV